MKDAEKIVSVLKRLTNLWEDDENMYSLSIKVEIDEEFMKAVYGAINLLSPMRPKRISVNEDGYRIGNCPNCNRLEMHITDRCMCGQKLDWSK